MIEKELLLFLIGWVLALSLITFVNVIKIKNDIKDLGYVHINIGECNDE